jgi:hypothetical protein
MGGRFSIRKRDSARWPPCAPIDPHIGLFDGKWNRLQNDMENK